MDLASSLIGGTNAEYPFTNQVAGEEDPPPQQPPRRRPSTAKETCHDLWPQHPCVHRKRPFGAGREGGIVAVYGALLACADGGLPSRAHRADAARSERPH